MKYKTSISLKLRSELVFRSLIFAIMQINERQFSIHYMPYSSKKEFWCLLGKGSFCRTEQNRSVLRYE